LKEREYKMFEERLMRSFGDEDEKDISTALKLRLG